MMTTKTENKQDLETKIETLRVNLNNPAILNNPGSLASLNKRIAAYEGQLASFDEEKQIKKEVKVKAKKPIKEKNVPIKKEKIIKEKTPIKGKFKIGDKVKFFHRASGKDVVGVITYQHATKETYTVTGKFGTAYPKLDKVTAA